MINKGLILKTAAVVSAVSVLIITGCQGGNKETAAVNNKSVVKETSIVSEKDREKDIETVVRSNGLKGQDTEDLRNDNERETASDRRVPEATVEVKQPEDEGTVAGEGDRGADAGSESTGTGEGYEAESAVSDISSDTDMGGQDESELWDGEYTDYVDESGQPEYAGDYDDEYTDENAGAVESGEGSAEPMPEPEVSDTEYEESGKSLTYLGTWASTGYCPCSICCGQWASGYTSSGTLATEGRTVACGNLPMGTTIYIGGWGYRVVEDLGVEGEWVDIFYADHASASAHGLQYVDVYLVN